MSIGLAVERIAESLKHDKWEWTGFRLCRSDYAIGVNLKGEAYAKFNNCLTFDVLPMNKAERKLLSKLANEKYQNFIADLANSPGAEKNQ